MLCHKTMSDSETNVKRVTKIYKKKRKEIMTREIQMYSIWQAFPIHWNHSNRTIFWNQSAHTFSYKLMKIIGKQCPKCWLNWKFSWNHIEFI